MAAAQRKGSCFLILIFGGRLESGVVFCAKRYHASPLVGQKLHRDGAEGTKQKKDTFGV
jgi:hypothetical protein